MMNSNLCSFFAIQTLQNTEFSLLPSTIFTPILMVSPVENSVIFLFATIFLIASLFMSSMFFIFFLFKYFFQRSGLWRRVIASDCDKRQLLILA